MSVSSSDSSIFKKHKESVHISYVLVSFMSDVASYTFIRRILFFFGSNASSRISIIGPSYSNNDRRFAMNFAGPKLYGKTIP